MSAGWRSWAAGGPYPGRLPSPRLEKTTITVDRYGDRVAAKTVSDPCRGFVSQRVVRDGRLAEIAQVRDPYLGRTEVSRIRSESPPRRGLGDPLFGRMARDDPVYGREYMTYPLYRRACGSLAHNRNWDDANNGQSYLDDPFWRRVYLNDVSGRSYLDEPLGRTRRHWNDHARQRSDYYDYLGDPAWRGSAAGSALHP